MKRSLLALAALLCTAAPAFADKCAAATEAATRSAIASADASGRRTATVRVDCQGEHVTLVVHRSGSIVSIREVQKPAGGQVIDAQLRRYFSDSSPARVIRLAD